MIRVAVIDDYTSDAVKLTNCLIVSFLPVAIT